MNNFCQKLTVLRRLLGKGQKVLASEIGVKQETISKWELGKMPIPDKRLDALAHSLECTPEDFIALDIQTLITKVSNKIVLSAP
jgi:transcriptional regulator with XRE-family HTH domain